jgi:anti-sigma B factor antagonist
VDLHGSVEIVASVPVLSLSGGVDLATVAELRDLLLRLVMDHPGRRVVVDLDGVETLDDTGLGILLGAAGRAREIGGDLAVVCGRERVQQRFAFTGLDRAITVAPTVAALRT